MLLTLEKILLNSYYILVGCALVIRDILWLRIVLVSSGICIISYGVYSGNFTVIIWNSIFAAINAIQIIRLLIERRPVYLDDDVAVIYEAVFSTMRKKDFLTLWNLGYIYNGEKKVLCQKGVIQHNLYLIINGEAEVIKNGKIVTTLGMGKFVAEISFVTGKPASADVVSKGDVSFIMWNVQHLAMLKKKHAEIYSKLQHIITCDLSSKLTEAH